jgi:hypothetical protein
MERWKMEDGRWKDEKWGWKMGYWEKGIVEQWRN